MNELYRTYEVLVEESVHPTHSKREKTTKPCLWELDNGEANERRMRSLAAVDVGPDQNQDAEKKTIAEGNGKKRKTKGKISVEPESAGGAAENQSGQSSEYPPFFVEHPECDWLKENDWLKDKAFVFTQGEKRFHAYPQGAFLKRVEQMCGDRITRINTTRIARNQVVPKIESQASDVL
jgi:hypothetical protein